MALTGHNMPASNITPYNTPVVSPEKDSNSGHYAAGSNRRSPRANVSSLAYDANRKNEPPLVRSTAHNVARTGLINPCQVGVPPSVLASTAGQIQVPHAGVMSPKGKKRPPSVTSNVLEKFLDNKRAKKQLGSQQSPSAKSGGVNVSSDDLKSQSDLKFKLAKDLDVILKETLKPANINKIRQRVENAGFQAIPVPEPMPKDLFCYAASLYVADITETDPAARAAELRKNCLEYVVGQLFNFTKVLPFHIY